MARSLVLGRWLSSVFWLSGFGSLGAQMAWSKILALGLGHEVPSVFGVLTAVMTGLAIGGAVSGRTSRRSDPLRAYAWVEVVLGLSSIASALILPALSLRVSEWIGISPSSVRHWSLSFLVPLLLLLPATIAMGLTLPLMAEILGRLGGSRRHIGRVYAVNTFGACCGCGVATFLLMPHLGFSLTLIGCGSLNLLGGLAAFCLARSSLAASGGNLGERSPGRAALSSSTPISRNRLWTTLFVTGFLGIGFEVTGVRVLSQIFENTIYSFALALSIYLVATALGAAVYQAWGGGKPQVEFLTWTLSGLAICVLVSGSLLPKCPSLYEGVQTWAGGRAAGALLAEVIVGIIVFGLPCLAMGACFSHVVSLAEDRRSGIAPAVAWNYAGGACAGMGVGVWLLPALGFRSTFLLLAVGYLLVAPTFRSWTWGAAVVAHALVLLLPADLRLVKVPPGQSLVWARVGPTATVSVLAESEGNRSLRVNNRFQMGGTAARVAQTRQAHLPILLHPHPERALFLGPGTGITLGAATVYPELMTDAVELVPEVLEAMPFFEPSNRSAYSHPRVRLYEADARRFVRVSTNRYDVIVADLFHPAQDGSGSLYTREHFQAVRNRLRPGGLFCQWLPLHQLDPETLNTIVRTFRSVFSSSDAWLLHFNVDIPVLGLIGRLDPGPIDWIRLAVRRIGETDTGELRAAGLANEVQLLGCWLTNAEGLRAIAGDGVLNTDDLPEVMFQAPRRWRDGGPANPQVLLELLNRIGEIRKRLPDRAGGVSPMDSSSVVRDFVLARDRYLAGLARESGDGVALAVEDYFAAVTTSLYFTPAYARLVGVIQAMALADKQRARSLYERLLAAQPDQPLGRKLLAPLFEGSP